MQIFCSLIVCLKFGTKTKDHDADFCIVVCLKFGIDHYILILYTHNGQLMMKFMVSNYSS
jgi:hypothetical protein